MEIIPGDDIWEYFTEIGYSGWFFFNMLNNDEALSEKNINDSNFMSILEDTLNEVQI